MCNINSNIIKNHIKKGEIPVIAPLGIDTNNNSYNISYMYSLSNYKIKLSKNRCLNYRKKILKLSQKVGALHIGGSFSSVEILDVIYNILIKKNLFSNVSIFNRVKARLKR